MTYMYYGMICVKWKGHGSNTETVKGIFLNIVLYKCGKCLIKLYREEKRKYRNDPKFSDRQAWANSADPDQTAPRAVWTGSTLFAIPSALFGLITLW